MTPFNDLLQALLTSGFVVGGGFFTLTGFPQPSWVHSDRIEVLIDHAAEQIQIEVKFEHHQVLLKYGPASATLLGMKRTCAEEWFPVLEQHFQKCVECYDLQWHKEEDLEDEVVPIAIYTLHGKFPAEQSDRVLTCISEIRSVLILDSL